MKLVISSKDGKSVQKDLPENLIDTVVGKKIGEKINGSELGFEGYEFELTGGSDIAGFPMRTDLEGSIRRRIFTTKSLGVRVWRKGMKVRKSVAGNTVHDKITQLNLKVLKAGSAPLAEPKTEEAPAQA